MKLNSCSLLVDENIPPDLITFLRNIGIQNSSLEEAGLLGKSDQEIIITANKSKKVVVTQDADFGKIIFTTETEFEGII